MYTTFTQITPAIRLHRNRVLPVAGTVMVRLGQKVNADDVIAEAVIPVHHVLVDVVRVLGLSGPKAAEPLIQRKVGETLGQNDIIAETGGLFSRIVRTPGPGKIVSILDGQVLIETETKTISLKAKYSGTIAEILSDRGAVIETNGALIQGVWGNGKFAVGPLLCKAEMNTNVISSSDFEITARGSIIASATCLDAIIFEVAASLPVAGLILGSMPYSLCEKALAQPYPILLVDGFGKSGINSAALKILSLYNQREVTLNADLTDEPSLVRPEILISAPIGNETAANESTTTKIQLVRIHTAPFMGQVGTFEKLLPGTSVLPNGLRVCAASVIMDNKERKTIPITNLDMIGTAQQS
ncbi:MAG: hypothetical protein AB9897_04405 [Anaerolineaceae bacterium]